MIKQTKNTVAGELFEYISLWLAVVIVTVNKPTQLKVIRRFGTYKVTLRKYIEQVSPKQMRVIYVTVQARINTKSVVLSLVAGTKTRRESSASKQPLNMESEKVFRRTALDRSISSSARGLKCLD